MPKRRFSSRALREKRTAAGYSQSQLAERLNITGAAVCFWETGRRVPHLPLLPDLADVLDCPMDELFEAVSK